MSVPKKFGRRGVADVGPAGSDRHRPALGGLRHRRDGQRGTAGERRVVGQDGDRVQRRVLFDGGRVGDGRGLVLGLDGHGHGGVSVSPSVPPRSLIV